MEEAGVRVRPRSTQAESHKEPSLLDPTRPDSRQPCHQVKSFLPEGALHLPTALPAGPRISPGLPATGRLPRHPPAAQGSGPSTPTPQAVCFTSSVPPSPQTPRATPLSYPARPGPPTVLPGGGCRSPSAIFSVRSRSGCSRFPLTVHSTPLPGSTQLPAGKRALARYDRKPRITDTPVKAAAMPERGTQGACPPTVVSRQPHRQRQRPFWCGAPESMRTNGCRPQANCRSGSHICAGRSLGYAGRWVVFACFGRGDE